MCAGPWVQPKGHGQVILKVEDLRADEAFDADGFTVLLPSERRDSAVGVFAEYGLTDRVTLQLKGDWQDGRDLLSDYQGRGPIEIGATYQLWRDDYGAVSLYAGYADGGEGRNAEYAAPGVGDHDVELRASAGRSFATPQSRFGPERMFVDLQGARRFRQGLPDETRLDLTVGGHYGADWLILAQAYGGVSDGDGARWLTAETSVVRRFGAWSLQAGWRQSVAGRDVPVASGPVIAIWRRF